jgi:hypothetical protein
MSRPDFDRESAKGLPEATVPPSRRQWRVEAQPQGIAYIELGEPYDNSL